MTLVPAFPKSSGAAASGEALAALRSQGLLAALVAAQFAAAAALRLRHPGMTDLLRATPFVDGACFVVSTLLVCAVAICFMRVVRSRPDGSATLALFGELRRFATDRRRLANGLPVMALMIPFAAVFGYLKINIPNINPYGWDATFEHWDRVLFLGHVPYDVLRPVMAIPFVTFLTYLAYNAWFALMWGVVIACAFARTGSALRTRYLTAFLLVWFVQGSLMAIAFSSLGPCFYEAMGHLPNPYQPMMDDLREASARYPILTLEKQQFLWEGYRGEIAPFGISAMPSIHNATAVLMALASRHFGRAVAAAFAAYTVWIFLGSVSLGWHYAVDGLIALPTTVALWVAAGRLAAWWHRPPVLDLRPGPVL